MSCYIDSIYKCTKSKLRVRDLEGKSDVRGNQGQIKLQVVVDSKLKSQRPDPGSQHNISGHLPTEAMQRLNDWLTWSYLQNTK
jgi:hypothetical protein